jgi:hypothetical protein
MSPKKEAKLIPCDADAPQSCVVEGPNGWYTRPWEKGEKVAYKKLALMKPDEDRTGW